MTKKIILLLDYKGRFTSKWSAKPYRSGMDLNLLEKEFSTKGFAVEYLTYPEIDLRNRCFTNEFILYTSSEDSDLLYKSYIEDIIYALELQGAILIPNFKLLKAHHNKVFMELLRDLSGLDSIKNIKTNHFGTYEDFLNYDKVLEYPKVFKGAAGAVSSTVSKTNNKQQVLLSIKKLCRSMAIKNELWDFGRFLKHKQYIRESKHRKKFILQTFIPNMDKDWKIIVFGDKYFVLERTAKKGDFRASGSGIINYNKKLPNGLLDYAKEFYLSLNIPFLAMDIGFTGKEFCLIEFQAVNFGTHTVDTAPFYFIEKENGWVISTKEAIVEKELVKSVANYINKLTHKPINKVNE